MIDTPGELVGLSPVGNGLPRRRRPQHQQRRVTSVHVSNERDENQNASVKSLSQQPASDTSPETSRAGCLRRLPVVAVSTSKGCGRGRNASGSGRRQLARRKVRCWPRHAPLAGSDLVAETCRWSRRFIPAASGLSSLIENRLARGAPLLPVTALEQARRGPRGRWRCSTLK